MTRRRRWPEGAEERRRAAITTIHEARALQQGVQRLLADIYTTARLDPSLVELMSRDAQRDLAFSETNLADAERYLVLARSGETDEG